MICIAKSRSIYIGKRRLDELYYVMPARKYVRITTSIYLAFEIRVEGYFALT